MFRFEVNAKRFADPFKNSFEVLDTADQNRNTSGSINKVSGRWRSIRTMYFVTFSESFGNSIILTSMWSYLKFMDGDVEPTVMGQLTGTQCLFGLLSSIICGILSSHVGCTIPLILTTIAATCSNIFYVLPAFMGPMNLTLIFISRGLAGIAGGSLAVTRVYLSAGTTIEERSLATSHLVASQMIAFTVAPVIQMMYVPIGEEGFGFSHIRFTMYTLPAITNMLLCTVVFFSVLFIFKEVHVDDVNTSEVIHLNHTAMRMSDNNTASWFTGLDILAVVYLNVLFSATVFTFGVKSTVAAPYGMHILGWSRQLATRNFSLVMFALAGCAIVVVIVLGRISKRIDERIALVLGMVLLVISSVIIIPFGPGSLERPPIDFNETSSNTGEGGCPWKYAWCDTTPAMPLAQYIIALAINGIGYPMLQSTAYFIYAKTLQPKHQGVCMGIFSAMGNIGRLVGSVYGGFTYSKYGVQWAFGSTCIFITVVGIGIIVLYSRLIPYTERNKDDEGNDFGK